MKKQSIQILEAVIESRKIEAQASEEAAEMLKRGTEALERELARLQESPITRILNKLLR